MTQGFLHKGEGWRWGWKPTATLYKALLGGDNWALELTEAEFKDFCRLLAKLVASVKELKNELMEEEKITCEIESDLIWLEVEGYPDAYSLRLLLNQGRRGEGNWTSAEVQELSKSLESFLTAEENNSYNVEL